MNTLNAAVREYTAQLHNGQIQKAYKAILDFMANLRANLSANYPDHAVSALYFGYMDMSYFAFTPPALKARNLKIAIVYLHQEGRFELWLAGNNRKIQTSYIELLSHRNIGGYTLSKANPGVDFIIASPIAQEPDFDRREELKRRIEERSREFEKDLISILGEE